MDHIDKKHQESYLCVERDIGENLKLKRHIRDEIQIDSIEEERIDRRYGSNAEVYFNSSLDASIRESVSVDYTAEKKKREEFWSMLPPYRSQGYDRTKSCIYTPNTQLLAMDEHPKLGSPFITYSFDGLNYKVKRMDSRSGRIDEKNPPQEIQIDTKAIRAGVTHGHPLFLTKKSLYIFTPDLVRNRIAVESPTDLAIPDTFYGNVCILRSLDKTYTSFNLNFIEEMDLLSGKILTYQLHTPDSNIVYDKLISTWHPKQYICSSRNTIACVDLRVSKGQQIYSRRKGDKTRSGVSSVNIERLLGISKGPEGKICAMSDSKIVVLDMRYFEYPFCKQTHPVFRPEISVGKSIALYNSAGNFHFCNPHDPGDYKYMRYVLPEQLRSFSWIGKSNKTPYSVCAFLFMNFLHVHHVSDGEFRTLKREKEQKYRARNIQLQNIDSYYKSIEKLLDTTPKLSRILRRVSTHRPHLHNISASASLPRPTLLDEITLPKRSIEWHLSRVSDALKKQIMCSGWKKYILQDTKSIKDAKGTKDAKSSKDAKSTKDPGGTPKDANSITQDADGITQNADGITQDPNIATKEKKEREYIDEQ